MQPAVPSVNLEVWTQGLAANWSASGYWDRVFGSGALGAVGPLKLNLTGRFLNATTQLVSHGMVQCSVELGASPAQQEAAAANQSSVVTRLHAMICSGRTMRRFWPPQQIRRRLPLTQGDT